MHTLTSGKTCWAASIAAALVLCLVWQAPALAQNGTWTELTAFDGNWSNSANWAGGTIADGAGNTADFSTLDISAAAVLAAYPVEGFSRNAIQLDSARTIGNLIFGDANTSSPGGWELYSPNDPLMPVNLTLAGTSPTITVHPLGPIDTATLGDPNPEFIDDAFIGPSVGLVGSAGFTKAGNGTLTIHAPTIDHDGDPETALQIRQLSGVVNVNAGTLRFAAGTALDFETVITPDVTSFNVAGGATLQSAAFVRNISAADGATITTTGGGIGANAVGGTGIAVAPGGTVTINNNATASTFFANVGGAGSTVNFNIASGGLTTSLDRDWALGGAPAQINFTGTNATQSQVRMRINGGTFGGFAGSAVHVDNTMLFTNTNTGGNTNSIGSLSGTSTATLQGGAAGSVVTYQIGNLNTNTNFAGAVTTGNGINIFKVGTGTQEFSGTLTYAPTTNATPNRRGGIMRVEAGTVKLSGDAAIPAGVDDTGTATNLGLLYTSLDIRAGATFDVSATTTPYSTPAISQVVGAGTIVGNYTHGQGILAPGDTLSGGNTDSTIATAGTLTFANTLNFVGSGQINFDISPSLVSGNDLLQVNGANLNGSPVLKVGFLGGAAAGQYTVLNSTTPLSGLVAGWTVQWEGRGAAPTLVQTANQVKLDLGAISIGNLNWRGNVDGVWNAGAATGTANWHNTGTASSDKFFQLDNVAFRDTYDGVNAPTTTTITLNTVVFPSSVVVNSSLDYSIAGTGRITGGSSLVKQGTGMLTITTANDYSGGTTISGGILNMGASGMVGSGNVTLSGGEMHREAGTLGNNIVATAATTSTISNNHNTSGLLLLNGSISGSGNLVLENNSVGNPTGDPPTDPVINGIDFGGDNSGFTGSITIGGPTPVFYRSRQATSVGTNAAWEVGNNGSTLAAVVGANSTFVIGSLAGGTASTVSGHESSGGVGSSTYQIGGLNASTEFAGIIKDGRVDLNVGNFTAVTKVGTGTLTLSGLNTYTGDTRVQGGTLSVSNAFLADAADVFIASGAVLNLNHSLEDTIDSLFLGGVPMSTGTWGATGSGAANINDVFFSGMGRLLVQSVGVLPGLVGDYNGNGVVDAADYTVWRDNLGGDGALLGTNRDPANMGVISLADYDSWKANFGNTAPGGGSLSSVAGVPEPSTAVLWIVAMVGGWGVCRRRCQA